MGNASNAHLLIGPFVLLANTSSLIIIIRCFQITDDIIQNVSVVHGLIIL